MGRDCARGGVDESALCSMSWSGHSLAHLHAPTTHACGKAAHLAGQQRAGKGRGGSPLVGDPSAQTPNRSLTSRQTRPTHLASGTPTQRQEAGAGNYGPPLEVPTYADTPACMAVLTTTPTNRPTDIRAAFYIMTTAHDYFLSIRSLLIHFTRY